MMNLQSLDQRIDALQTVEDGGNDYHRAALRWYPGGIVQAREQARLHQERGEPVHQRHRQLTHAEQKNEAEKNESPSLHSERLRPVHETECAEHRDQENSAQIKRERKTPNASFDNGTPRPSRTNRALQQRQTFID